jgi:NhaA family Na+:H+ antiporter
MADLPRERTFPRRAGSSGQTRFVAVPRTQLIEPLQRFLRTESGSAGLLLAATVVALLWANSPWSDSYATFWGTELTVSLGDSQVSLDLQDWVNDGLMCFFFFVVGLEVKRELVMGDLADRHRAAVPLTAALTGLIVPALVFLALNPSGQAAGAWGVVISTDTAFLLGALALAGPGGGSPQLRVFLLTLAVADDVGALTVVALFYTEDLSLVPLLLAAGGLALMLTLRRLRVWRGPAYFVIAMGVWLAMEASGVHPTLAGVVIAMFVAAYPPKRTLVEDAARRTRAFRQSPDAHSARLARLSVDRAVSPNERLQALYHPWTSYVIVPLFALANAGVDLGDGRIGDALQSRLTWGIVAGLVLGKLVGILVGVWAASRSRFGERPQGIGRTSLVGGAALSGIGFTISLFIVDLALEDPVLADEARMGVLAASVLAAGLGWAIFRVAAVLGEHEDELPSTLSPPVDPSYDHVRGPVDASLTLVEYADFECPFCSRATGSVDEILDHFGDRLRYVFRHLPLTDVHPHALLAARASEAAAEQDRFWEMHDALFDLDDITLQGLLEAAEAVGLDVDQFETDLRDDALADRVAEHVASAQLSGVRGSRGPRRSSSATRATEARTTPPR